MNVPLTEYYVTTSNSIDIYIHPDSETDSLLAASPSVTTLKYGTEVQLNLIWNLDCRSRNQDFVPVQTFFQRLHQNVLQVRKAVINIVTFPTFWESGIPALLSNALYDIEVTELHLHGHQFPNFTVFTEFYLSFACLSHLHVRRSSWIERTPKEALIGTVNDTDLEDIDVEASDIVRTAILLITRQELTMNMEGSHHV